MLVFQGHAIWAILADIGWPLVWLAMVKWGFLPKIGRGVRFQDWALLYILILLIPNSTYAMFEIKHLIFIDNVADNLNIWSFIVFGGVSLFGFLSALFGTKFLINLYAKSRSERLFYTIFLSLVLGFGGVVGLLDYASLVAIIIPPALIFILWNLLHHTGLILLGLATATFFFVANLLLDFSLKPSV